MRSALLKDLPMLMYAIVSVVILSSCQTTSPPNIPSNDVQAPSYQSIADRHNDRLDRLGAVNASGSIDLRWTDDNGRHFESLRAELWIALPDRTAMNVQKLGERLMWLGSNGSDAWMVDFGSDQTVLYLYAASSKAAGDMATRPPIQPHTLLKLFGLARLATEIIDLSTPVTYDAQQDAWVVTVREEGEVLRLFLDQKSWLPIRVELLTVDLEVLRYSTLPLRRYESVQMVGVVPGTQPRFPTLVDMVHSDGSGSIKVAMRSPRAEFKERYFDLEWIKRAFHPDRIEGKLAGPSTP